MKKFFKSKYFYISLAMSTIAVALLVIFSPAKHQFSNPDFQITYPFNESVFPPEFPAPTMIWYDANFNCNKWQVTAYTGNGKYRVEAETNRKDWQPTRTEWDSLKLMSDFGKIHFEVKQLISDGKAERARIKVIVSRDRVDAPILYREMPLPFIFAETNLDSMAYRLVNVGSEGLPHLVMQGFKVCGNCHSFDAAGTTIGLDFDAARRDKGGYFITKIKDTIQFDTSNFLSWTQVQREETFGAFSKLSPDGRYVVTTIKDRVINKNFGYTDKEIRYSQLFFPVNGILAVYDRQTKVLTELVGANDTNFVQTNATWTADGKHIIFCRAQALPRDSTEGNRLVVMDEHLTDQYVDRKRTFKYDLYIVPFNEGKGGEAKPIPGASANGKSNYFPAVSPDGRWLAFCQAENFMLLMPDSKMFMVPLFKEASKAEKMKSNLWEFNSWHAWSPNSKWIVFVSKAFGPYTDMFLTHIDEKGNASAPVLIERSRVASRAANYPEFVNIPANQTFSFNYIYVSLDDIYREISFNNLLEANKLLDKYIQQGQFMLPREYEKLVEFCTILGRKKEAETYRKFIN